MTSDEQRCDRAVGAMLGLAIGDAIGTTLELSVRDAGQPVTDMIGGGPFRLKPGEWTDDTAMALCLADSLLACNHLDQRDLMQRFCRWWRSGENSCTGTCFDIGNATREALIRFERTGDPVAGSTDPQSAGNGSLMRLAPATIRHHADLASAIEVARGQSVTTHAAAASVDACAFFAELLVRALNGVDRAALFSPRRFLGHPEIAAMANGRYLNKERSEIASSGYIVDTLEAALWCVHRSTDFRKAVLLAANLGEDADTVAAVTGQLAGAIWGERGIPENWGAKLVWRDRIRDRAIRLFELGTMAADSSIREPSAWEETAAPADNAQAPTDLSDRQEMLRGLVNDGTVRMTWAPEVMEVPAPIAKSRNCADRIRGMLLGLAIGDALGNTSEGMLPRERLAQHGEIRDYLPNRYAGYRAVGLPSDDTQLAFWTLEHLLSCGGIEPDALAALFCSRRIFGIGRTMRAFVDEWPNTKDWRRSSQHSAGNGALMRIAPVVVLHTADGNPDLWVDAVVGTAVTHNDRAAIASSVAFVGILAELRSMTAPPAPEWWIDSFVRRARPIEGDATAYEPRRDGLAKPGPLWKFVDENVRHSLQSQRLEADGEWYSGAFLLETVPAALRILIFYATDPEEAIVRAVNDTKDNDTIAAIVGAAVGALHGESALPQRWRDGLLGRVVADVDDRKIFELLEKAVLGLVTKQ